MSFTLQELHDEIEADPFAIGYKEANGDWKRDDVIGGPPGESPTKGLINTKNYVVDRESVEMQTVRGTTTYQGYNTLAIDEQEWLTWMTPNSGMFEVTPDMKLQLSGRTPASNGVGGTGDNGDSFWATAHRDEMAPAMLALIEAPGSRAEVLWDENSFVSISDVARAANL